MINLIGLRDLQIALLLWLSCETCHGRIPFLTRTTTTTTSSSSSIVSSWGNMSPIKGNNKYSLAQFQRSSLNSFIVERIRGGDDNNMMDDADEDSEQEDEENLLDDKNKNEEEEEEEEEEEDDDDDEKDETPQQDTIKLSSSVGHEQQSIDESNQDRDIENDVDDDDEEDVDDEEEDADNDEEEVVDDEEEEKEDTPTITNPSKSANAVESKHTFDEPFTLSPIQELSLTFGSMILFSKLNLNDPKIIRFARCVLLPSLLES